MRFDPTVLDHEARRYETLATELEEVGEAYTDRLGRLDWEGERADSFAERRADRDEDFASTAGELREVAASIRHLGAGARAAIEWLRRIAAEVRDFFASILAAARAKAERLASAVVNVGQGLVKLATIRPNAAADEFSQAWDDVLALLPIRPDELPSDDDDPEWFRVDETLAGAGDLGVYYRRLGRPPEAA